MTRTEAIAMIHQQLGFRSDQSSNIIINLVAAQTHLESSPTKPWFLLDLTHELTTVDAQAYVSLPSDFLEEYEEKPFVYVPDDDEEEEVELKKGEYANLKELYKDSNGLAMTGEPEAYSLDGDKLWLFPIPDDEYTLVFPHYQQDVALTSDVENEWLQYAPLLVMGIAGGWIAAALRDSAAASIFAQWAQAGRVALYSQNEARKHARFSYQMGGPV